jgi:hypothetical protein
MGYIWLAGGIPALLYLWSVMLRERRGSGRRPWELLFLTMVVVLLLVLQPSTWWSRFTVWLHVLGLPSIAVVLERATARWRIRIAHLITLTMGALAISFAVYEAGHLLRRL